MKVPFFKYCIINNFFIYYKLIFLFIIFYNMKINSEERQYLIDVFNDTVEHFETLEKENNILIENSRYYSHRFPIKFYPEEHKTIVSVINQDTFDAAKELGTDTAVLNMASLFQARWSVLKKVVKHKKKVYVEDLIY